MIRADIHTAIPNIVLLMNNSYNLWNLFHAILNYVNVFSISLVAEPLYQLKSAWIGWWSPFLMLAHTSSENFYFMESKILP